MFVSVFQLDAVLALPLPVFALALPTFSAAQIILAQHHKVLVNAFKKVLAPEPLMLVTAPARQICNVALVALSFVTQIAAPL